MSKKEITLESLIAQWKSDNIPLTEENIFEQMSTANSIHAKYLEIFTNISSQNKKLKLDQIKLANKLYLYYSGKGEGEVYNKNLKITKAEVAKYIERDVEYINVQSYIDESDVLLDAAKTIVGEIGYNRSKNVQQYFAAHKFFNGF